MQELNSHSSTEPRQSSHHPRPLELLAPAKDLACGMAAIRYGADAVYIGADRFGARSAAGNSVADIAKLCDYAHQFGARVYVTVNTLIYEDELAATRRLLQELAQIGVDALLVQDMGVVEMVRQMERDGLQMPQLHASTQCDNRTPGKVAWLQQQGFRRAVLARELSVDDIRAIHQHVPDMELEAFVHGALCVSYSGQCYASQHCFARSANRGECAQVCRMKFDLLDADGKTIVAGRHLLSLKDLCLIDHLEELADAGVVSFKIEGRLKDADYVKNVVAAYSERLDRMVKARTNDYRRASIGHASHAFCPDVERSFNRGFTTFFLHGRQPDIVSLDTPKARGQYVGRVKEIRHSAFTVAGTAAFANGDGLCFVNDRHELEGFRVNRVEGNLLFPLHMPTELKTGMPLYRNHDEAFERMLEADQSQRQIPVDMVLAFTADGFKLTMSLTFHDQEVAGESQVVFAHQAARKPQAENIRRQLTKLGNTPFVADEVKLGEGVAESFIPSSLLSELRHHAVEHLSLAWKDAYRKAQNEAHAAEDLSPRVQPSPAVQPESLPREYRQHPYLFNVANSMAKDFYEAQGLHAVAPALELKEPEKSLLMQCRHCLRYTLGHCVRHGGKPASWREPLYLRMGDGRRFRLEFRCDECQMNVYAE